MNKMKFLLFEKNRIESKITTLELEIANKENELEDYEEFLDVVLNDLMELENEEEE